MHRDSDCGGPAGSQIGEQQEATENVHRHLKGASPINSLPPEILARIFEEIQVMLTHFYSYKWLYITQVCTHWRLVALGATSLWRVIIFCYPRMALEMLQRSGNTTPLVVMLPGSRLWNLVQLRQLLDQLLVHYPHRIQTLYANIDGLDFVTSLVKFPPSTFESLIDFDIGASYEHVYGSEQLSSRWSTWVSQLPSLKRLRIRGVWRPPAGGTWAFKFLSHIEELLVSQENNLPGPSITQLFSGLQYCSGADSKLTKLVLKDLNDDHPYANSISMQLPTVHLPRLRLLSISNLLGTCTRVLRHILLPPTARLDILASKQPSSDPLFNNIRQELSSLISALLDKHLKESVPVLRQLSVTFTTYTIRVIGYTTPDHRDPYSQEVWEDDAVIFSAHFALARRHEGDRAQILTEYCLKLSLSQVQTVHLDSCSPDVPSQLYSIPAAAPKIISLHLRVEAFHGLPSILRPGAESQSNKAVPLPMLELVDIGHIDIRSPTGKDTPAQQAFRKTCVELEEVLSARACLGARPLSVRLEAIMMYRCDMPMLDLLCNAFATGILILQGPRWVQVDDRVTMLYEDFIHGKEYQDQITMCCAKFGERPRGILLRFFIAARPLI